MWAVQINTRQGPSKASIGAVDRTTHTTKVLVLVVYDYDLLMQTYMERHIDVVANLYNNVYGLCGVNYSPVLYLDWTLREYLVFTLVYLVITSTHLL